ncbi:MULTISPECIES: hypothetical protein [unclassified Haladaptatus]|uniref:DUF7344 domain-containing protein n=1 Tax=unclassified Haladaptatus TaxID=2622732 RepID=UPI00209BC19C|nr:MULTISPECIES: hypothetical protein [unclassified Haladaptatus]MCO8243302.1 hypothetical protein [Haladaptatus sp. AB643]MCO8253013.1 hypothetical protein [Haladaptatus sp. AB618]
MSTTTPVPTQPEQATQQNREPKTLTQETAFKILSCQRRRNVVHYLLQQGESVSLHELSKQLAAWENEIVPEEVTYEQRMRVYTALRQAHLPKMDDAHVVHFDANGGTIRLTDDATKLEVYLDIVPHDGIPWSGYYLGLGGVSVGLITLAWIGFFPFDRLPGLAWGFVISLLFLASAVAHKRHDERHRLGKEGRPPL